MTARERSPGSARGSPWLTLVLALVLAGLGPGCGARTGPDEPEHDPSLPEVDVGARPRDAGRDAPASPLDASRDAPAGLRDAGRDAPRAADAGRACTWRELTPPLDVLREPLGMFGAPEVVALGDDFALLTTHDDGAGRLTLRAVILTGAFVLRDLGALDAPTRGLVGTVAAAGSGSVLGACEPERGAEALLVRRFAPNLALSSRQPLGAFDVCADAASVGDRMLLALGRSGADGITPFVMHFASAGEFRPRPALSDPSARGRVATTTLAGGFAWAGPTDAFGRVEATFLIADTARTHAVAGFPRLDGVPPALAEWPYAPRALAIVHSGLGLRLRVVAEDGSELVRNDALAFQMFPTPVPAMATARSGLLLAQLDFGDLDPRSGRISVSSIAPDGTATNVGAGPYGVSRRGDDAGAEVAAAASGDRVVVHWTWSSHGRGVVVETRTHALVLGCE